MKTMSEAPMLELGMQELESMEAPGFWTVAGVVAGVSTAGASAAASYAVTASIIT